MNCNSLYALQRALIEALTEAVDNVADQVKKEIDESVSKYYQGYIPGEYGGFKGWVYERTNTLKQTPVKENAVSLASGAEVEVRMNTELTYLTGTWSMENVIDAADNLTHGGWRIGKGVSIWEQPIKEMDEKSISMWRKALLNAGIPVE